MALAQDHLEAYDVCYTKAVDRLHRVSDISLRLGTHPHTMQLVIEHEYSATYAYYKVPSPWLQVKLLRLLQYYPPSGLYTSNPIPFLSIDIIYQRTRQYVQSFIKFYRLS